MEANLPFEAWLVDLPARLGAGGRDDDPLALRDTTPRWPAQPGRRQPRVRRHLHVLLPAGRHLLRVYGRVRQSLPRRDAGEDAPLLLLDAGAARSAGRRQVRRRPRLGAVAVGLERGDL